MSSSSMRKLGQRATHKERSQPLEREKLGLLEKHEDYSLRAKDFNKKKAYLKVLRQKASERNEDEFYHKMLSRRGPGSALKRGKGEFTGTAEGDRGNRPMSVDVVRLLKTQDQGYLRTMRNVLAKDVAELEQRVAITASFAGEGQDAKSADDDDDDDEDEQREIGRRKRRKANKIVFSADAEERDTLMLDGDGDNRDESGDEFAGFDDGDGSGDDGKDVARTEAEKLAKLRRKLKNSKFQLRALTQAENELEIQRARMAKTATVGGISKSGKKIKIRERKR